MRWLAHPLSWDIERFSIGPSTLQEIREEREGETPGIRKPGDRETRYILVAFLKEYLGRLQLRSLVKL